MGSDNFECNFPDTCYWTEDNWQSKELFEGTFEGYHLIDLYKRWIY